MKAFKEACCVLLMCIGSVTCELAFSENHVADITAGRLALETGQYEIAAREFEKATKLAEKEQRITDQARALVYLADAYQALGLKNKSIFALTSALPISENIQDLNQIVAIHARLGAAYRSVGAFERANQYLEKGIRTADRLDRADLLSALWNELGNVYIAQDDVTSAIHAYRESMSLAEAAQLPEQQVRVGVNLAKSYIRNSNEQNIAEQIDNLLKSSRALDDNPAKASLLLSVGVLHRDAQRKFRLPAKLRRDAYSVYLEGLALAEQYSDKRTASYALGYIGRLYEDEGRYTEALRFSRQAIFYAQEADATESQYRWEWQKARLLKAEGDTEEAIKAYRQAIGSLQTIRNDLVGNNKGTFEKLVGPVFFEMADLLLTRTSSLTDPDEIRKNLLEVRQTMEQVKAAEVADYFQNECMLVEDDTPLDQVSRDSVIIYPVILRDRIELLVSMPSGLRQYTSKVDARQLRAEVRKFRVALESYDENQTFLPHAQTLYRWLIAPWEKELANVNIETLVFIPDGSLRSIPMSALHDGSKYLIEKYAVATTPGLSLTNPRPIPRENVQVLINGISDPVQGFPALPSVKQEVADIQKLFPNQTYMNNDFQLSSTEKEMSEGAYSIVHIATHGQFNSDHRKSFLLTYDDKLTMSKIEETIGVRRFKNEPLELLVLSACQTAAGDDKAALGLAGIALKAGARSALATLWFVNDDATSRVVAEFYRQLKNKNISKSRALQNAQKMLVRDKSFHHPSYWAPFLLIGNWV